MVAVDILSVPVSTSGNNCLLVVQDYFTKWANAIPLPNQKAITITRALVNLFATMGMPDILHSDQGQNFESAVLKQTLDAFGIQKRLLCIHLTLVYASMPSLYNSHEIDPVESGLPVRNLDGLVLARNLLSPLCVLCFCTANCSLMCL